MESQAREGKVHTYSISQAEREQRAWNVWAYRFLEGGLLMDWVGDAGEFVKSGVAKFKQM